MYKIDKLMLRAQLNSFKILWVHINILPLWYKKGWFPFEL